MTMKVTSKDGSVTVDFLDGTPQETIKRAMQDATKQAEQTKAAPPPIPQPIMPEIPPPGPGEQLRAGVRPAVVAGGATLGGAAGMLAGPAGMLAGAMGGAAGGSLAFDSLNDAITSLGLEPLSGGTAPGADQLDTLVSRTARAGSEAVTEGIFTGGFSTLFPVKHFLAPLLGKMVGVRTDAAKQMAKLAEAQGVQLSAVDVGGPLAKGFARVLGVFPFVGKPLRVARGGKESQVIGRIEGILNEVAPTSTLAGEMGIDLARAAEGSHSAFRNAAADLYDGFRVEARSLSVPAVPTDDTTKAIREYVTEARLGEIPIKSGDGGPVQVLKGGIPEDFEKFLVDAQALPDHLTYDQWARLKTRLEGFIDKAAPDPFTVKRVVQIKQAMEADLNALGRGLPEGAVDPEKLASIVKMKQEADAFFSGGIVTFQTPTASKFGRFDKNMFRVGPEKAGSLNSDELLKPVFNAGSGQSLADLRALVGEDAFRRASRTYLDDVVSKSFKSEVRGSETVDIFDLDAFQTNIGLVRGAKNRKAAVEEIFKGTGVKVSDLEQFVENARIAKLNDPSQFVARRATLGGAGAVAGAIGLGALAGSGAGAGIGLAGSAAVILLARHAAKILADPRRLKALTAAFAPETSEVAKRALVLRVARSIGQELRPEPQVKPTRPGPAARGVNPLPQSGVVQ